MSVHVENCQDRIPVDRRRLARAGQRVLAAVGRPGGEVEVAVVDDDAIRRLNWTYRGVARRTDVLAFPLEIAGAPGGMIGQVVISAPTAARQARRLGVPRALELDLLVTHGVLHLVGYDDRDPVEAALMHRRERSLLGRRRTVPARLWTGLLNRGAPRLRRGTPRVGESSATARPECPRRVGGLRAKSGPPKLAGNRGAARLRRGAPSGWGDWGASSGPPM
jgi:probable rRNA maturation factor